MTEDPRFQVTTRPSKSRHRHTSTLTRTGSVIDDFKHTASHTNYDPSTSIDSSALSCDSLNTTQDSSIRIAQHIPYVPVYEKVFRALLRQASDSPDFKHSELFSRLSSRAKEYLANSKKGTCHIFFVLSGEVVLGVAVVEADAKKMTKRGAPARVLEFVFDDGAFSDSAAIALMEHIVSFSREQRAKWVEFSLSCISSEVASFLMRNGLTMTSCDFAMRLC